MSTLPQSSNFSTVPKIATEVRKEEKVGDREKEWEHKCWEEREMASQTDCLAAPGSPALSVIWFWGQRLSPLMNIGPGLISLTKERELFSLPGSGKFISGIHSASTRLETCLKAEELCLQILLFFSFISLPKHLNMLLLTEMHQCV